METHRVVFHLDESNKARTDLVLGNLVNLLADLKPEALEVELVANASGILTFLKSDNPHADQIRGLASQGVRFCLCANSMRQHGLPKDMFLDEAEVVSSGVGELVRKQTLGWAYIRP